ncbi:hypothetical protein SLEP1_g26197 [Rubroshorea leprosula]|uniref:Uncharacterized protein n=1 Tax=Rubroshorea leprosula TaxID=152421 RepID=A0AAV5JVK7_9ROSI|nr:hypothetical protein SLEP1_g26197 [Rubroshorea leprosula]
MMGSGYPSVLPLLAWQRRSMTRLVLLVKNLGKSAEECFMFPWLSHDIAKRADKAAPPKRSVMGKRKSVAHPLKSRRCRTSTSSASKQSKVKAPTPSKEKDTSCDSESDESSWGDPDPEVIEQIKRLRPICGDKHLVRSIIIQALHFSEGFGSIPIPGDDKVPSKFEKAKWVEALAMNMEEALANPEVHRKIMASEIGEPPLPNDIFNVVDSIIDWTDPTSFTTESMKKAKANEVPLQKPTMTRGGVKVSYGTPNMTKKLETMKTQLEVTVLKPRPISKLPPFRAGDLELVPRGFIPARKTSAASSEKVVLLFTLLGVEKDEAKAAISVDKEKGKKVTKGQSCRLSSSIDMNRVAPKEFESDVGDATKKFVSSKAKWTLARQLLKNLDEMNEDKDVSLARFGLMPLGSSRAMGRFAVPAMLERWACQLLDIFPNLTMCSKAKKVVVEDAFSILCVTMQHMEVTPFAKMNEDFFYLCGDALDDAKSINFEVNALCTHLSTLAKAYLGKTEFGIAKGDMAEGLDE